MKKIQGAQHQTLPLAPAPNDALGRITGKLRKVGASTDVPALELTAQERHLIDNFRAMKTSAREMMVDLSGEYKRTMPAERPALRVLRGGWVSANHGSEVLS